MKRFVWQWLAASSLLLAALAASAETRPKYGGVAHIAMRGAPMSLDPADRNVPDSFARRSVTALLFDTLVTLDASGAIQPVLADSWQSSRGDLHWQFLLRRGVKFEDGTPLSPEIAAASLRFANPSWTVRAEGDNVVIERDAPAPSLLAQLALPGNAIVKRDSAGKVNGTGPFRVADWQPGIRLTLSGEENCWRGRPFLESIEIEMGKSFRDQMNALQSGKADLIEVAPEQQHRVSQDGHRLASSVPMELLALLFTNDPATPDEKSLRSTLAWSVERGSIRDVLLQGAGQPSGSILPTWMSGYGFVFSSSADLAKARQLRNQVRQTPNWKLAYDPNNPLDRLIAERIALNARDAGLSIQTTTSPGDLRLVHIALASGNPWVALQDFFTATSLPTVRGGSGSVEEAYSAEQAALSNVRVIPLLDLPVLYASTPNLRNWNVRIDGSCDLASAWMETMRP